MRKLIYLFLATTVLILVVGCSLFTNETVPESEYSEKTSSSPTINNDSSKDYTFTESVPNTRNSQVTTPNIKTTPSTQSDTTAFETQPESNTSSIVNKDNSRNDLSWNSIEEALVFYKNVYLKAKMTEPVNTIFRGPSYDQAKWDLIELNGNRIVLSYESFGGRGGTDHIDMVREELYTIIAYYAWSAPFPEKPQERWIIRNSNYECIARNDMKSNEQNNFINLSTAKEAFEYLYKEMNFNEDYAMQFGEYVPEGKYYNITVISKTIKKQGGSGTVGIYHVYEDGLIIDMYQL